MAASQERIVQEETKLNEPAKVASAISQLVSDLKSDGADQATVQEAIKAFAQVAASNARPF